MIDCSSTATPVAKTWLRRFLESMSHGPQLPLKPVTAAISVCLLEAVAHAALANEEEVVLHCTGKAYVYEAGFGQGIPKKSEQDRLVWIDLARGAMEMETLTGKQAGSLTTDGNYYWATITYRSRLFNTAVYGEKVTIDRYSGAIQSFYMTEPNSSRGFVSFLGECERAKTKF